MKKKGGGEQHKIRLRAQLKIQSLRQQPKEIVSEPRWWRHPAFLVSLAVTVVCTLISLALTLPSLLPKISVNYIGPGNTQNSSTFQISNDGVIGLNDVTAVCHFTKVNYADPRTIVEGNKFISRRRLGSLTPGAAAIVECPSFSAAIHLDQPPISASLAIGITYRPDFTWIYGTVERPFDSVGSDLIRWTPPRLL